MSELSDFLTDAFDEAIDVMGEACTVDGVAATGVWSAITVNSDLTETGYMPSGDGSLSLSKTDFVTTPDSRSLVVRNNVTYIITGPIEENDSGWVLNLTKQV